MSSEFSFTICGIVPEACACCLQPCSILLHDDTVYYESRQVSVAVCGCLIFNNGEVEAHTNIFERLPQPTEVTEAKLHHTAAPLVHSIVLVRISSNSSVYRLQIGFKLYVTLDKKTYSTYII